MWNPPETSRFKDPTNWVVPFDNPTPVRAVPDAARVVAAELSDEAVPLVSWLQQPGDPVQVPWFLVLGPRPRLRRQG